MLGGQGACARVVLVVRECIWNAPAEMKQMNVNGTRKETKLREVELIAGVGGGIEVRPSMLTGNLRTRK